MNGKIKENIMRHIKLFESLEDDYAKLTQERNAATKPLRDEVQKHYDEIRDLQEKIKKIEASYKEREEAIRKQAVETEPNSRFLSRHDKMRFNPEIVKRSAELTKQIIAHILGNKRKVDEDDIYEVIKKYCGKEDQLMLDDTSKIYKAVQDAGLYISGE